MEVQARIQKFGDKTWCMKTIILPDFCATLLEKYKFEVVEYHNLKNLVIFFQTKDNPDVDVISVPVQRPEMQSNIADGFKRAFEWLTEIEQSGAQVLQPSLSGSDVVAAQTEDVPVLT